MGKRILIVDDASFMRMIARDTLQPYGFEICDETTNGSQAVKMYE